MMYCWAHSLPVSQYVKLTPTKLSPQIWPVKGMEVNTELHQADEGNRYLQSFVYILFHLSNISVTFYHSRGYAKKVLVIDWRSSLILLIATGWSSKSSLACCFMCHNYDSFLQTL